jgi:phosphoribosylamine---glycine ligase
MNILVLGSGGREHAFAWKLKQSKKCGDLFIAPGNAGTALLGTNVDLSVNDFEGIKSFVLSHSILMVVVGPEEPLVNGIVDFFKSDKKLKKIMIVGPSAEGAKMEGSKAYSKELMKEFGIPTAAYKEVTTVADGMDFLKTMSPPYVLKADGLAAGKGVVILDNIAEAEQELGDMLGGKFGAAGHKVVIEEFLAGIEFSVFVLTDGKDYKIFPIAKDYKRVGEGDKGLNTGGMGAVSPVPFVDELMMEKVEKRIIKPTIAAITARNIDYHGFVFIGLISVAGEPMVIEYNCRMGDPETEVVLPRLKNDLVDVFKKLCSGKIASIKIKEDHRTATAVVLTAGGYPGDYEKGDAIVFSDKIKGSTIFHAGTKSINNQVVTNGGRVLVITSFGRDIPASLKITNRNVKQINYKGKYWRRDIGMDMIV